MSIPRRLRSNWGSPITPTPPPATSPHRLCMPAAAIRRTTTVWRRSGIDDQGRHRPRPLFGAVQLPRIQGADRPAARRGWHPHLFGSCRRRVCQGTRLPRGTVGASEPHPARRHRVRLPRAGRSADARMGVDARRAAASIDRKPLRCPRSSARRSRGRTPRAPRVDRWSRGAGGMARRTAADVSARRRTARGAHACPRRRSSAADLDGDRHDPGKRAARSARHRRKSS